MPVVRVINRPYLFERLRRTIVQIGRRQRDAHQLRSVQQAAVVRRLPRPHVERFLARPLRPAVTISTPVALRVSAAPVCPLSDRKSPARAPAPESVRHSLRAIGSAATANSGCTAPDRSASGRQRFATERSTSPSSARTLSTSVGLPPFHLNGSVPAQVLDQPVIDNVLAKPIRLQVPLQPVEGRVDVAIRAAKLPLKCILRRVKRLLAAPQRGNRLRPAQLNRLRHPIRSRVDHADGVIEPVRHVVTARHRRLNTSPRGFFPTAIRATT